MSVCKGCIMEDICPCDCKYYDERNRICFLYHDNEFKDLENGKRLKYW